MASNDSHPPVNLLALDGGGIRGVSELLILHEIMSRIQYDLALPDIPRPCDYFHLIGGTSTGGLIALMLGRLRMNTKEVLEQYNTIAGRVFSKGNKKRKYQDGAFKASTLEAEMKRVVAAHSNGNDNLKMLDETATTGTGRAMVCTLAASNMEHPRRFRSYHVRENPEINCAIWEAARATTAAPNLFKRISIAEPGQISEDFLDAGIKCNNPTEEVLEEARLIFKDDRPVGCIVSIGTGHPGTVGLNKPDAFQKVLPLELIGVLKQIATSCEETANKLTRRFLERPDIYFRFSVTHGAGLISLEEWERMREIKGHTEAYLRDPRVSKSIDSIVKILCMHGKAGSLPENESVTLGQIGGHIPFRQVKSIQVPAFLVPFKRDPEFIGRSNVIQDINDRITTRRRVALCGIGGIGKSQIAIEYCYVWKEQHPNGHVFWVHASTPDRFEQAYKSIARELSLPGFDDPMVNTFDLVVNWLCKEENGPWLLVLDNADDIDMFFEPPRFVDFLPRKSSGTILITTRDKRVGARLTDREEVIMIEPFSPEDGELLLRSKIRKEDNSSTTIVQTLLKELGFIPLAITQAAAFISENSMSVPVYIKCLNRSDSDLQDYLDEDLPDPRRDPASENSVIRTWKISFDQIAKQRPRAAELLSLMAVLDRQAIPESLLHQEDERSVEFNKALGTLRAFSFVNVEKGGSFFEVHRLVHLSTQKWLALKGTQDEWQRTALELMVENFPSGEHETRKECEILLPHALAVLLYLSEAEDIALQRVNLLENVARYDENEGRYDVAYPRYKEVFQVRIKILGNEHPGTLTSMNNLASVLDSQGKYEESERIHRQELKLSEKVLGKEHPSTLTSINNLAVVLHSQGKYEEAERIYRQVLELREKVLGQEHPSTLTSMSNLALVLYSQGRYEEAERTYRQALELMEKVLGQEHPSTLTSMSNLALVLKSQGKYEEAERIYRQALELKKKVLGQEHPSTLTSTNNLASVLYSQGKYEESERIYRQVLELMEKVLSQEHPSTLTSINNLAVVLDSQGKYEEAERIHRQALELREKVLGQEHPSTLMSMSNLALVLKSQGKYEEAERTYRQALELMEKVLGQEHPSTLTSMSNLASLLKSQGKYEEAERIYRQALELMEKVLGQEHPSTLTSINNLASVLDSQGKYEEAERIHRQALELMEKVLSQEHPSTLTSMNNLAVVLDSQGKYEEAERIHRQALELMEKVLGQEHPSTLTSMNNLALVLKSQGKYEEAERIYRQVLELSEKVLGQEHPSTLTSMNNLASLLKSQGKYEEAERSHRKAFELREKVLGQEHPHTLSSLYSLAHTLKSLENISAAEALFRLELERCRIFYGPEHLETMGSLRNLASLLEIQGKSADAEALRQ